MYAYAALALTLLGLASGAPTRPVEVEKRDCSEYPYDQVQFTNIFPDVICKGRDYVFTWEGGSGEYNLIQEELYPGLPVPHPGYPLQNSTETRFTWSAAATGYPDNTTFYFDIQDAKYQPDACLLWYQNTKSIPVIDCGV